MNIFMAASFILGGICLALGLPIIFVLFFAFGMYLLFAENVSIPLLKVFARLTKGYKDSSGETRVSIANINASGDMGAYWYWRTQVNFCLLLDDGKVGGIAQYVKTWRYVEGQPTPDYTKGWKKDGR